MLISRSAAHRLALASQSSRLLAEADEVTE
jgi:hypothetical protein